MSTIASTACIVVPCYNEAVRLDVGSFIRFAAGQPYLQFVMVNDGSQDETLGVLHELRRRLPRQFIVVDLQQNSGKAEAVRQGILRAFDTAPDFAGYWDADLATPLNAITGFVQVLESQHDMDLVVASRMPLLGRKIQRHWIRQKIGCVCAAMASLALGTRMRDTQCGAKLFRVTPVTRQVFSTPFTARWLFDVELFARLIQTWKATGDRRFASRVFEYPLPRWDEVPGSTLRKMDFLKAGVELLKIYSQYLRPLAPLPNISELETQSPPARTVLPLAEKRAA